MIWRFFLLHHPKLYISLFEISAPFDSLKFTYHSHGFCLIHLFLSFLAQSCLFLTALFYLLVPVPLYTISCRRPWASLSLQFLCWYPNYFEFQHFYPNIFVISFQVLDISVDLQALLTVDFSCLWMFVSCVEYCTGRPNVAKSMPEELYIIKYKVQGFCHTGIL